MSSIQERVKEIVMDKLNVTVELNDPFKNVQISEKDFDLEYIADHAQIFNIGVGLALRQVS